MSAQTYKCKGTVVGLTMTDRAIPGTRTAIVDIELDRAECRVSFPWGLADEPRLGDRVMVTVERLEE